MKSAVIHQRDHALGYPGVLEPGQVREEFLRSQILEGKRDNGDPFIAVRSTAYMKGMTRTGKLYSRWQRRMVHSLTARSDGAWFRRSWRKGYGWSSRLEFADHTPHNVYPTVEFREALSTLPTPLASAEFYPLWEHYVVNRTVGTMFRTVQPFGTGDVMRAFAHTDNAQDLTRNLFGKSRYRRDLVRAVATTSLPQLSLAYHFRGLVPIDWIVDFLRIQPQTYIGTVPDLRPVLRRLDQTSLRNLLRDQVPLRPVTLHDTVRRPLPPDLTFERVRDWQHLHDAVADGQRTFAHLDAKRKIDSYPPVELSEEALELNGTTDYGKTIVIADHETTLLGWGDEMRNCIYGYGSAMRSGRAWLGGVYSGDQLVANFEVRPGAPNSPREIGPLPRLEQLLGRMNRTLGDDLRVEVEDYLKAHGILCEGYWGDGGSERALPF